MNINRKPLRSVTINCKPRDHQLEASVKHEHQTQISVKQSQDPEEIIVHVQKFSLKRCDFFTLRDVEWLNDMVC